MNLREAYNQELFLEYIKNDFLPEFSKDIRTVDVGDKYRTIKEAKFLGNCEELELSVFELKVNGSAEKKISQARDGFRMMKEYQVYRALIAYFSDDDQNWRFSLMQMSPDLNEKCKVITKISNPRRYSFYLGPDAKTKTAENFLVKKGKINNFDDLLDRFNVEIVTKEFYQNYKKLFEKLLDYLKNDKAFNAFAGKHGLRLEVFAKKLLGQIVFIYFLQRKGWLGAKKGEYISKGDKRFLRNLFEKYQQGGESFFNDCLEHLFYDCLNKLPERAGSFYREKFDCQIPFLNGGLFEPVNDYHWKEEFINIPNDIFSAKDESGILDIFDVYNFTIDENTPDDQEVSVDPEMLGKVFENLLEDNIRKGQGAFYTPREIVHYMCQESLINYLDSNSGIGRKMAEEYVKYFDPKEDIKTVVGWEEEIVKLDKLVQNIKVCDPACGSGAFLVGMLNEIIKLRYLLRMLNPDLPKRTVYDLKKETIQNCLYGVDIDPGAIDIAKLRFWLSIVVDEDIEDIEPLPNLDYKIMQGNSLLEDLVIGDSVIKFNFEKGKGIDKRTREMKNLFEENKQTKLFVDKSETLVEKLEKYHSEYFSITDPDKKKILKNKIDGIEDELIQSKCKEEIDQANTVIKNSANDKKKILKNTEKVLAVKEVLDKWKKDHLRPFFPWKLHFGEVFNRENGGFDVVIANPPYVNAMELKKMMSKDFYARLKEEYSTARGTVDLYIYFMEKGVRLLSPKGVLAYITPNKYLSASYGKVLREYLYNNTKLLTILDYSGVRVFTEASIYPIVSIYSKDKNELPYTINIGRYLSDKNEIIFKRVGSEKLNMLNDFIWSFLLNDSIDVVQKIISSSVPLCQSGKINATSTTAEADFYSKLINEKEGIKLINTGTIDKYACLWGKKELTNKGVKYTKPLLLLNKEIINERRFKMYKSPKIIFAKIALETEAFYDELGEYASLNTNCLYDFSEKYDPKYILSWVNSNIFQFLFNCFFESLKMSKGYLLYSSPNLLNMYIKEIPKIEQWEFSKVVDKILEITKSDDYINNFEEQARIREYKKQINQMFCSLYGLTEEEIKIVEEK